MYDVYVHYILRSVSLSLSLSSLLSLSFNFIIEYKIFPITLMSIECYAGHIWRVSKLIKFRNCKVSCRTFICRYNPWPNARCVKFFIYMGFPSVYALEWGAKLSKVEHLTWHCVQIKQMFHLYNIIFLEI